MKIIAKDIEKSYNNGNTPVLKGVSLEIEHGEFIVVCGASGSGKSTLLSVLSGIEKPDKGTVCYNDEDITVMNDKQLTAFRRKYIGFIFQQYYLLPHLNVDKNVKLGANLAKNSNYREIIKAVGLEDKIKSRPAQLSGGEQQRVCIARALAKKPQILFLDEPTGALDETTGRNVLDFILNFKKELALTVVMITHNLNIADTADRVIKINSGKIVEEYKNERPKTAYEIGW